MRPKRPKFNLQFFGGRSKTRQVRKRDPNPWLENIQAQLNNVFSSSLASSAGNINNDLQDARAWSDAAKRRQWGIMNAQQGMLDSWKDAYGQARGFLNQLPGQMKGNSNLLNEMLGVVRSGNIPSGVANRLNAATKSGLQSSMGSMLNDLAGRGVVDSSITSRGISDLSGAAADAFNRNYLNAYNSVLGGYSQGLQHSQSQVGNTLAALGAANGMLGNVNSGIGALTGAIGAYGQLPGQYYQNALAPLMPAYNFWKDLGQMYYGHEDYDTVVKQGK